MTPALMGNSEYAQIKTRGRTQEAATTKCTLSRFKVFWWQTLLLVRNKWMGGFANSFCCCCFPWQFILQHSNNLSGWNMVPLWFGSIRGVPADARASKLWMVQIKLSFGSRNWFILHPLMFKMRSGRNKMCSLWHTLWQKSAKAWVVLVWSYLRVCHYYYYFSYIIES